MVNISVQVKTKINFQLNLMREIDMNKNLLLQSEKVLAEQWAYAEIKLMTVMTQLDFCAFYIICDGRADLPALMALVHKSEDTIGHYII
jgi:hypothetical protein